MTNEEIGKMIAEIHRKVRAPLPEGYSVPEFRRETIAKQIEEIHRALVMEIPAVTYQEWSDEMPAMPPGPFQDHEAVGVLRVRNLTNPTGLRVEWGVMAVWWLGDSFYATFVGRQDGGAVSDYQRFQLREGKVYGRQGNSGPYDLLSEGWQYAGWDVFPAG